MFRRLSSVLFAAVLLGSPANAGEFPLPDQKFDVTIRDQNVRSVLEELSAAIGLPILMSDSVQGRVSASFQDADAKSLLDEIADRRGLDWRFDGNRIRVTSQTEQVTRIVDLDGVKLKTLRSALETLNVYNERFKFTAVDGEFAMIVAPPDYTAVVEVVLGALIETEAEKREERKLAEKDRRELALQAERQRLEFERFERQASLERARLEQQLQLEFQREELRRSQEELRRSQRGPQVIRNGIRGG